MALEMMLWAPSFFDCGSSEPCKRTSWEFFSKNILGALWDQTCFL